MAAGLRVIRGPDWNLDDNDGGEGHVGTVTEVTDDSTAKIVWDGGQVIRCRAAKGQGHDLRVLDNATVGTRHPHIVCDECSESGILGIRWKCSECYDFDLCSPCYFSDRHDCNHQFYMIEKPGARQEKQEKRSKSMKMRVLGIFPEATVVRGHDWGWGDQDGGEGQTGVVLELLTPATHSARSTVKVQWENGRKNVYRMGYKGKVDLQYMEEAPGIECYPQHLPVFDAEHYKEDRQDGSESITEGDNVVITVSAAELRDLQKSRSGWAVGMAECIGKVGKVQGFAANGDAIVTFGNKKYRLIPAALKKVSAISVGSHVRILVDEEKVKALQDGHGGYNDRMRSCLGKVGEVIKLDEDGDVVVKFGDRHWVFAPACCTDAAGAPIDHISRQDDGDSLKIRHGSSNSGGDLLGLLAALAQVTGHAGDGVFLKALADKEEDLALSLLRKQPKLAKSETQNLSALHIAANRGLMRATAALVDAGADMNYRDKDGDTPLMAALAGGCDEVSMLLVKKGCDVCVQNKEGQTAGHKAAYSGFTQLIQLLLSHGADFNAQDKSGDTPLHDAISKSRVDVAELILSWPRLDLRRANKNGHPPLHFACMKDRPAIIRFIIKRDRSIVNMKKEDGFTPLHVCACNDHDQAMMILIEQGNAKVNLVNDEQQQPLHVAAHEAALDCARLLMQHGADVNARDSKGNTALHVTLAGLAMSSNDVALLLALLGQGSKVREEKRTKLACLLIQHGADPQARNDDGLQALDACPSGHSKIKDTIKRFMADNPVSASRVSGLSLPVSATSQNGDSSCAKCHFRTAEILLVPCGHRAVCRGCCSELMRCPLCNQSVKQMFDQGGKRVKEGCTVM